MYGESAPLCGAGVKVAVFSVQIASADGLWPETIEQGHLSARCYAHYTAEKCNKLETRNLSQCSRDARKPIAVPVY